MIRYRDIETLQIEVSNFCNAACPQCPRNFFGGKTIPSLPLRRMNLVEFKSIFTAQLLHNLKQIYFCGTYGDPLTNTSLVDMIRFIKDSNIDIEVGVHTNGGVGRRKIFHDLASCADFVAFGIDGLQDTNHIYRRHVKWSRVMENCTEFIGAGGKAIWDFIVFRHNQHQVDQARELSRSLGFENFTVKRTGRFLDRSHKYNNQLVVYNNEGNIDYVIAEPTDQHHLNQDYELVKFYERGSGLSAYAKSTEIRCNAVRAKEVYIGADGFVFPCGWLHDRLYGPEAEMHSDHVLIKTMIAKAGGIPATNIYHNSLEHIVNGAWFDIIEHSWNQGDRLERCGIMCGKHINLIGQQNIDVTYKV